MDRFKRFRLLSALWGGAKRLFRHQDTPRQTYQRAFLTEQQRLQAGARLAADGVTRSSSDPDMRQSWWGSLPGRSPVDVQRASVQAAQREGQRQWQEQVSHQRRPSGRG